MNNRKVVPHYYFVSLSNHLSDTLNALFSLYNRMCKVYHWFQVTKSVKQELIRKILDILPLSPNNVKFAGNLLHDKEG